MEPFTVNVDKLTHARVVKEAAKRNVSPDKLVAIILFEFALYPCLFANIIEG